MFFFPSPVLARTGYLLQRSDMSGVGDEPDSLPLLPGGPLMTQCGRKPDYGAISCFS